MKSKYPYKIFTTSVNPIMKNAVRDFAERECVTQSEFLRRAIEHYLCHLKNKYYNEDKKKK